MKNMKKFMVAACMFAVLLYAGTAVQSATVYKLWLCDTVTGGSSTSLNGIHSGTSGVANGAFAIVVESSTSRFYVFQYNSGVTASQNVTTHPWVVQPINGPVAGVWYEISGVTAFK